MSNKFKGSNFTRVSLVTILLLGIGVPLLSTKDKNIVEYNKPVFFQGDRTLGENATDIPNRACGADLARKLVTAANTSTADYNKLLDSLATTMKQSFTFLDFRSLTRGTIPYDILDACRRASMGTTLALADTNKSGLPSFFNVGNDCSYHYFKNTGNGRFANILLTNVPRPTMNCPYQGGIFVNVNNDDFPDLVIPQLEARKVITILNDGKGNFSGPVVISEDIESLNGMVFSMTAADLSNTGREDIVVANRFQSPGTSDKTISSPVRILRNTGVAPYWSEDTMKSIPVLQNNWTGRSYNSKTDVPNGIWYASYAVLVMDLDKDGWQDILEIGDGQASHMLWSNKGKTFIDKTFESEIVSSVQSMGITPVNLEGGKDPWLFISDAATAFTQQCMTGEHCPAWHGNQFLDTSKLDRVFRNNAPERGLTSTGWAFGAIFADLGLNGYPSLVVATGDQASGRADEPFQANFDKPYLYMYNGETWADESYSVLRALKANTYTNKVAVTDVDGDKKPDLVFFGYETSAPYVLFNRTEGKGSTLTLFGSGEKGRSTKSCINCVVQIKIDGHKPYTMYYGSSQQNFGVSSENVPLTFGFGKATKGEITVTFIDGKVKKFIVLPDKNYVIKE